MIANIVAFLQQVDIKEKLENAPEGSRYEIGVIIGTYLPFVVLAILAYIIFNRAKNRKDLNN